MAEKKPLDFLVKTNDFLEQLPKSVIKYFNGFVSMSENFSQSYVDVVCRYAAWRVNITVERVRQNVLKSLNDQYGFVLSVVSAINTGKQVISNPLGAIGGFFSTITKPLSTARYYITTLAVELPRLAKNLANITAVLPPEPPNPKINFDAFQLKVETVSMDALLSADSLPDPEVLFPEPASPWSKEAFQTSFESGTNVFADETNNDSIRYVPKSKKTISGGESTTEDIA